MADKKQPSKVSPINGKPEYKQQELQTFLEAFSPEFPVYTARIRDAGGPPVCQWHNTAKTLHSNLRPVNEAGANDATKQWNIYLSAARLRGNVTSKAKKEDVEAVTHLWVDLDPEKTDDWGKARHELLLSLTENLPDGVPKPTHIVDSGNGYWAFWRLAEEIEIPPYGDEGHEETIADIEAANNWLAKREWAGKAGDSCFNIERIFRAPGTINWPTKTKLKAGYIPRQAMYLESRSDPSLEYSMEDFGRLTVERSRPKRSNISYDDADTDPVTLDEIEERTNADVRGLVQGGPNENGADRSKYVWAVCCRLADNGFTEAQMRYVLLNEDWWPSNHIYEQNYPLNYVNRNIDRAKTQVYADNQKWRKDKTGAKDPKSTHNIAKALGLLGLIPRFDTFTKNMTIAGLDRICGTENFDTEQEQVLVGLLGAKYQLEISQTKLRNTISYLANKNRYDSLKELIEGLPEWDGVERADRIFIDYAHAEDIPLNAAIGRNFLFAAMDRVYNPGGEVQFITILEGPQDSGKSTLLRTIALRPEFFTDNLDFKAETKVVMEQTEGKWIIEIAELAGKGRREDDAKKAFITRQIERGRWAYGRRAQDVLRRFMLAGSINEDQYLTDPTGNRRYWMLRVGDNGILDCDRLAMDMPQIWAEVRERYRNGERHDRRLPNELKTELAARQEKRMMPNEDAQRLYELFGGPDDEWAVHGRLTAGELNQIILDRPNPQKSQNYRVRDYKREFKKLGYIETKIPIEGDKSVKGYYRNPNGISVKDLPRVILTTDGRGQVISIKTTQPKKENGEPF